MSKTLYSLSKVFQESFHWLMDSKAKMSDFQFLIRIVKLYPLKTTRSHI